MPEPTIAIHHRSALIRECLRRLILDGGWDGKLECLDLHAPSPAPTEPAASPPDLILVDMESLRGREGSFHRWCGSTTRVVVIAERYFQADVRTAMRAGASGYLLTRLSARALNLSLRLVLSGRQVFPTEMVRAVISRELSRSLYGQVFEDAALPDMGSGAALMDPYRSILRLVGLGYGIPEIAETLETPETLVRTLLSSFMKRTGIRNRTQAAVWAVRNGLTDAGGTRAA